MKIVGITGPIGHGKTSFGLALRQQEPSAFLYESREIISKLAETWLASLPDLPSPDDLTAINNSLQNLVPILNKEYGVECTFLQIKIDPTEVRQRPDQYQRLFDFLKQPRATYTSITEQNKEYFRPLLQWMGGYFVAKVDFGIWYKEILRLIKQSEPSGARLAVVSGLRFPEDASILRSAGAIIVGIERPGQPESLSDDPTERERSSIMLDSSVSNNGTLTDLEMCAARFYSDLKNGHLQPRYTAV